MVKKFDLVIFGASGFTGEYVVEEVALTAQNKTWAVAGRSEKKLRNTLEKVSQLTGLDLRDAPVIIADVSDYESLVRMAKEAQVVVNCVGPYQFYGEPVVKACVENGSNHVDISGEPQYLEAMQHKYNEKAKDTGVYVVGACGWDSIPVEAGLSMAAKHIAPGELNAAETFVSMGGSKASVHFGTFHSMIYGFANRHKLKDIRKHILQPLPKTPYKLPRRTLFYHNETSGWCLPFLGSDKSVVNRTQQYNYYSRHLRPVMVNTYWNAHSALTASLMMVWGVMFGVLASFQFGRNLMEKYPRVFSFGLFSHEGPTRDQLKGVRFSYWIFANGWKEKMTSADENHSSPPDQKIVCRVDGPDPGYTATANCVVSAAWTLLDEKDKLPKEGGVYSPGAAFGETDLIDRLNRRGLVTVSVVEGPSPI